MNFFKRIIIFIGKHLFFRPIYLYTYIKNYFNSRYIPVVQYYKNEELVSCLKAGKSLIRFGDGEIYIINGGNIGYQNAPILLQKKLKEIINSYSSNSSYILGINKIPLSKSNSQLKKDNLLNCWLPTKVYWELYFNKSARYFDSAAFYFNETLPKYFEEYLRSKLLIVVTNIDNINSLKNNNSLPFANISYIETPKTDTFDQYNHLFLNIKKLVLHHDKNKVVVLLACGPASKPLALDLSMEGIVSIDIGRGIEIAYSETRIDHVIYPEVAK